MAATKSVLNLAVIGAGGFAGAHQRAIAELEARGECRLLATCDPSAELRQSAGETFRWRERGVQVFEDYQTLLAKCAGQLQVVTVPTPIPLHAQMHRACVEAGVACYLEKPPTLWPEEFGRMLAIEATAQTPTQVGFHYLADPVRQALKLRLLAGEFGALREVSFLGLWPRALSYYQRNSWAGRLTLPDGYPVMDSPIGNVFSHFAHNVLFWAGAGGLWNWATPADPQAELYRANDIQGPDAVFLRSKTADGVDLRFCGVNCCLPPDTILESISCESADIRFVSGQNATIRHQGGKEQVLAAPVASLTASLLHYFAFLRGDAPRPTTTLEDCRPFIAWNSLAYAAGAGIHHPAEAVRVENVTVFSQEQPLAYIPGIREVAAVFAETGRLPSEQGVAWASRSASES